MRGVLELGYPGLGPLDWLGRQARMPANFLMQLLLTNFALWVDMRCTTMTFMQEVSTCNAVVVQKGSTCDVVPALDVALAMDAL